VHVSSGRLLSLKLSMCLYKFNSDWCHVQTHYVLNLCRSLDAQASSSSDKYGAGNASTEHFQKPATPLVWHDAKISACPGSYKTLNDCMPDAKLHACTITA
jgi:hypothetical protein